MKRVNAVQLTLTVLVWGALFVLPLMGMAPNRILTPKGLSLWSDIGGTPLVVMLILGVLLTLSVLLPAKLSAQAKKLSNGLIYFFSAAIVAYLFWLAGDFAASQVELSARVRCSFGAGFWALLLLWLMSIEAVRPLAKTPLVSTLMAVIFWLPLMVLVSQSHFQYLSLFIEYRANKSAFDNAFFVHSQIVLITLVLTIVIGLWLGIRSYRSPRFGRACLSTLSILQTVPSIALFGLLLAPLSYLTKKLPFLSELGISGIGMTPAIIALLLYSLLPMVRSTQTGLKQVSPLMLEAAYGMGMSRFQCLWKVHFRLALPVILSGLRITTVQAIGLTMVAALIGAGGFGAIMFRGLSGSAIDLVLLGVIPVVIMAAAADTFFKMLVHLTEPSPKSEAATLAQGG
ncbi:ABC transporter permease [Reinekea marinisedimentorum]|uniref:Osmoprotectant transport system permease protein n=1 Tax=Reinekea marinisedimentorum TaxID=230495 RepID=A0A4R3HVA0_9GAMM|nr:ABC transporter permease [Reinekea marinisedimentorum]TCS36684.1 osmoprotectant transport system permease protein [Reinekea marinisedimentorum]